MSTPIMQICVIGIAVNFNAQFNCCAATLFLWRHEDTSSLRLLRDDKSGWQMISNFSLRQRLHLLLALSQGDLDERMCHEIKWSMLFSLRVQICLLSSVEFLCFACWNDAVWFLYLVLKSFSVSLMYVSVVLLSLRVTVAWQISDDWRKFPFSGHVFFCQQPQVLESFALVLSVVLSICMDEFKMCLLWLSMTCLVVFMPLQLISIVL